MNRVPDRKKLRRNYLKKKAQQLLYTGTGILVLLGAIWVLKFIGHGILDRFRASPEPDMVWKTLGMIAGVLAGYAVLANRACKLMETASNMNVPYAGPALPETLPAEEILVRGSEEPPVAQSEVLLRPAHSHETPAEELLRTCCTDTQRREEERQLTASLPRRREDLAECDTEYTRQAQSEATEIAAHGTGEMRINNHAVSVGNRYQGQCVEQTSVTVTR